MHTNNHRFQRISGILLILFGIIAIFLAILITPTFVTIYISKDHYLTINGIKQVNQYRLFLTVGGILSIVSGFINRLNENTSKKILFPLENTKHRIIIIWVIFIGLLGSFLRLYFYIINRSLWLDEAMLALNLVNRSFIDLLKPLSFNQGAPLGFLLAQKVVISILGSKDYILRLIPLTAGLVSILLMYLVSKKIGRHLSIILSLGLVALSQNLIYYSSELKQYSTDVLATLVLLLFCLKCLETKVKLTSIVVLGIVSSLTIWFSHPSVFICAGIFLTLGLDFALNGDTNRLFWLLGVGVVWGICIGFIYIINLRYLASNNFLLNFWNGGFAPLPPWSNIGWYKISMINMLKDPATLPANLITVGLLIIGIFSFSLRRWQLMMILLAPFLFLLITSALGKYPFSGRMLLFLIPLLLLLLAEGVERVGMVLNKISSPLAWFVAFSFVVYFLSGPITVAYKNVISPPMGEDIKPVMLYISKNYRRTDLFYLYYRAAPAFEFYAPSYRLGSVKYIVGITSIQDSTKYLDDIDKLKGRYRIWFVFSHNCESNFINQQDFILEHLNKIGLIMYELKSSCVSLYLYDLR